MRRRRERLQHPKGLKGSKRPRAWHRGRFQGRIDDRRLLKIAPALEEAEAAIVQADRARKGPTPRELRQARARDREDLLAGLDRVAPFVPSWV